MKAFNSTMRKGFQMTFENGMTVSVQWGSGNYCDNHFSEDFSFSKDAQSDTAEVAVIYNGELINFIDKFLPEECRSDGTVAGWLSADQVAEFIWNVKNYKGDN